MQSPDGSAKRLPGACTRYVVWTLSIEIDSRRARWFTSRVTCESCSSAISALLNPVYSIQSVDISAIARVCEIPSGPASLVITAPPGVSPPLPGTAAFGANKPVSRCRPVQSGHEAFGRSLTDARRTGLMVLCEVERRHVHGSRTARARTQSAGTVELLH